MSLAQLRGTVGEEIRPFKGTLLLYCICEKQLFFKNGVLIVDCMNSSFCQQLYPQHLEQYLANSRNCEYLLNGWDT